MKRKHGTIDPIVIHLDGPMDWKECVHQVLEPLHVPEEYERSVTEQIEAYGPYCILRPGMALIHGPAFPECRKAGMTVAVSGQPVFFCDKPVSFFIGLCAPSTDQYLQIIRYLSPLLRDPYDTEYLMDCTDQELRTHFQRISEEEEI